jgi:hypothetical protein
MFVTSQPHKSARTIYSRIAAALSFEGIKCLINELTGSTCPGELSDDLSVQ